MFSPDRYGPKSSLLFTQIDTSSGPGKAFGRLLSGPKFKCRRGSTGSHVPPRNSSRTAVGLVRRQNSLCQFPESSTTATVLKDRGFRPSDLTNFSKKNYLSQLMNRVFHVGTDHDQSVDHHEKIPLERLFTPAKDATEIVPQKKKKAFASSCFYSPDHPTIDDQVELAHKISVSLMDENNKTSKGQTMYMKRKNKSAKWIHQAGQNGSEEVEEEKKPSLEKPPLKLLLSPKGVQDYSAVQQHYEDLMAAAEATVTPPPLKIDISKQIGSTDLETLESPTGKGAALFAKRKKRMDKFIVDETTVQQQSRNSTIDGHSFNRSNQPTYSIGNSSSPVDPSHGLGEDMTFSGGLSEGNTFYTADVKVVQKTSLPTTPSTDFGDFAAHFSLLDDFSEMKNEDKRKSFNLAAKGWGTYGNFYTPLHFEV